jgi:lipopolysaccharide biosynthesis regulator YciM
MERHPTLRGMNRLMKLTADAADGGQSNALQGLHELILQLDENNAVYRCDDCGFSGKQLHWQCPSCKNWGTVAPIIGLDGD